MKIAGLILSVCMFLTSAAGCSTIKQEPSASAGTVATDSVYDRIGPSYSWDTSQWDLGVWYWGQVGYDKQWQPESVMNDKIMSEKTGLRSVTFTSPATADQEKLNAMIASRSLPEVISVYLSGNQERIRMLIDGGLVEDLLPLMEKYAPTFKNSLPLSLISWFSQDGKLYGFPGNTITGRAKTRPGAGTAPRVPFIRADIAEQLGIKAEDFMTQDGMVAALRKFKNSGILQDGVEMLSIGMTEWTQPYQMMAQLAEYFGLKYEDSNGNYIPALNNPKYKEMTRFVNRLYREGLFTAQNIMMKNAELAALMQWGRIFMSFGNCSEPMKYISAKVLETNGKINYIPVEPVRSSDGSKPGFTGAAGLDGESRTFISRGAKNKDRIIRFLEYLYSEEGQIQNKYGTEGITYIKKDGGYIAYTSEFSAELAANRTAAIKKYGLLYMPMLRDTLFTTSIAWSEIKPDSECTFAELTIRRIKRYLPAQGEINDLVQDSIVDPAARTNEADINSKIKVYMNQQIIKMITAGTDSDFEALWNEAMDYCERVGFKKLAEVQNRNYLEAKKKLGVDFTYTSNKR